MENTKEKNNNITKEDLVNILDKKFQNNQKFLLKSMDKKFQDNQKFLLKSVDKKFSEMEDSFAVMLYNSFDTNQKYMDKRFDQVTEKINSINLNLVDVVRKEEHV